MQAARFRFTTNSVTAMCESAWLSTGQSHTSSAVPHWHQVLLNHKKLVSVLLDIQHEAHAALHGHDYGS